jgi:hypothetical protein
MRRSAPEMDMTNKAEEGSKKENSRKEEHA